jgi:hypothetical protein
MTDEKATCAGPADGGGRSVQFRTSISTCTRFRTVRRGADGDFNTAADRSVHRRPPLCLCLQFAPPRSTIRPFFVFFRCSSGQTPRCGAVMEGCKWPQHVLHSWLLYLHMQCSAALSSSFQPGLCTGGTCREGKGSPKSSSSARLRAAPCLHRACAMTWSCWMGHVCVTIH